MDATAGTFVVLLIVGIFIADTVARWWRENEWRRRWKDRDKDQD